jgi:hypothetical protein
VAIKAARSTNSLPAILDYLSYLLLVPLTWPVCDILAICALYNEDLATRSNGNFSLFVVGAWNIALAINIHFSFVYIVINMSFSGVHKRGRNNLITITAVLALNPSEL